MALGSHSTRGALVATACVLPAIAHAHAGHGVAEGGGLVHLLVDHGLFVALGVSALVGLAALLGALRSAR